jgi:hypothetical protein
MYPHFDLSRCYRNALLQPHWKNLKDTPVIKMSDIEAKFRKDAQLDWIAYGWRRNDSLSRSLIMKQCGGYDPSSKRVFPLRSWKRQEVYDYLHSRGINWFEGLGRKEQGGLDFHEGSLRFLKEKNPEDWQRWLRDFPFSEIQVRELVRPVQSHSSPA